MIFPKTHPSFPVVYPSAWEEAVETLDLRRFFRTRGVTSCSLVWQYESHRRSMYICYIYLYNYHKNQQKEGKQKPYTYIYLLMVSTHRKNTGQNENLPQVGVKIKNMCNHHPVYYKNRQKEGKQKPYMNPMGMNPVPTKKQFYDENLSLPLSMPTPIEEIRHYQGTITHHHPLIRPFSWGVALEGRPYIPMKSLRRAQDLARKG